MLRRGMLIVAIIAVTFAGACFSTGKAQLATAEHPHGIGCFHFLFRVANELVQRRQKDAIRASIGLSLHVRTFRFFRVNAMYFSNAIYIYLFIIKSYTKCIIIQ